MRIAFFSDTYYPAVDGVVRAMEIYKKSLEAAGHEVRVFAPAPREREKKVSGASYCRSVEFFPYPQYRVPLSLSPCVKEACDFKPDMIHCHAMAAMALGAKEAAKKTGAPLIGTFHTMLPRAGHYISGYEGVQMWFSNACWKYLQWLYGSGFSQITCPSAHVQKEISKYGIKAKVLPNPVDVEKFSGAKIEQEARAFFGSPAVLFLGRVAKEKNIDFLLEVAALEEFRGLGARLLIAGEGPYKKALEKKAKKMGLEGLVYFAGKVDERLLPSFYSLAKCSVFPSFFETQGLAALESMACATPVVAIKGTAICEFVEDGKNGCVCAPDAHDALRAISKCMESKEKMGANAKKTAQKYSAKKCTQKLLEVYKGALAKKK
ncbi:MAG: glycosyltransferase [Candidatus Micrarchaeota archaeon]